MGIAISGEPHPQIGHVHAIGKTRMGKSFAVAGWVLQLIAAGVGVCVIDPHADLFKLIVSYLTMAATKHLTLVEQVVIVNPLDSQWAVGFNPLEIFPGEVAERKALFLADVITKVFQDDPTIVVRMRRLMRYAFLALMELGLTLVELPRFLVDREFREALLHHVTRPEVRQYWLQEFPRNEREATSWVSSTLNRLGPLVDDPDFRLIFGQRKSTINLRSIMHEGMILLVNTSKGQLMDDNSRLLGTFLVAQVQQTAMSLADLAATLRRLFWLVLDEFQNYVSPTIATLLEEVGKYKLACLLAHQHLAQIGDERLKRTVLSQCDNTICFRIDQEDASVMARKIFSKPRVDQRKYSEVKPLNWGPDIFGNPIITAYEEVTWRSEWEIRERLERRLYSLAKRQFWLKQRGRPPVLYRSFDVPNISPPPALITQLVDASGSRYAIPKAEARHEIEVKRPQYLQGLISGGASGDHGRVVDEDDGQDRQAPFDGDVPLWTD